MLKSRSQPLEDTGFTILEVLIAFTILGVAFVVLLQSFGTSFLALDRATEREPALMYAKSKLEEVGTLLPLEEGSYSGRFDESTTWVVHMRPISNEGDPLGPAQQVRLFEVGVEVASRRQKVVHLRTIKLSNGQWIH